MATKLDGFLRPYRGSKDDLEAFWAKFDVVAGLQKWDTAAKKAANLPLFLSDEAFTIWSEMADGDQKDPDKVKEQLSTAFGVTPAAAYRMFSSRSLKAGESVDNYAADLKKLLTKSGQKVAADGKDRIVIEQFISGLSSDFARQLRMSGKSETISECVEYVRNLRSAEKACEGRSSLQDVTGAIPVSDKSGGHGRRQILCYNCNGMGHFARDCTKPKRKGRGGGQMKCHFCDREGHLIKDCADFRVYKNQSSSRSSGTTQPAAAAADESGGSQCLSMPAGGGCNLPRIYADIHQGDAVHRVKAAVDTCSSRCLAAKDIVDTLQAEVRPTDVKVTSVDGRSLNILGEAVLQLSRSDDAVQLPMVSCTFLVVPDLSSLRTDIIIGHDLIAKAGGVELHYDNQRLASVKFGQRECSAAATETSDPVESRVLRHADIERQDNGDVAIKSSDLTLQWSASARRWEMSWNWLGGVEPTSHIGSGLGEYPRSKLSALQEQMFEAEIQKWLDSGYLVEHDVTKHGEPKCVLPLIAAAQEHKPTTPVRPCLDYRLLNDKIMSNPGIDAAACAETTRRWRKAGVPSGYQLLDIKKAYLQVHIRQDLQAYQCVVWQDKLYVLERMGFGMSVAPKAMDLIVKYATRELKGVDNYVDDLFVPESMVDQTKQRLMEYGLPTKPAEPATEARVLGLQIHGSASGTTKWKRRDGVDLLLPPNPTKRDVFSWCGRIVGHYPVCGWTRPACAYVKRLASASDIGWDKPVSEETLECCAKLASRLASDDPVHGAWYADPESELWAVWCDASNLATGVVLTESDHVVEDGSWLREKSDKRHINVAELEAALKGIDLAVRWNIKRLVLKTDSKTVAGWLRAVVDNTRRVKVGGLHESLVRLRLQVFADTIAAVGMAVLIEWVKSEANVADVLTRVPSSWPTYPKKSESECAAATVQCTLVPPIPIGSIREEQASDDEIKVVVAQLASGAQVGGSYRRFQGQLSIHDSVLYHSFQDPIDGERKVPVIPASLQAEAITIAHKNSGHSNWEATWQSLKRRCFFPLMATACRQHVTRCRQCQAASPLRGVRPQPVRQGAPSGPWEVLQIDTLELGCHQGNKHHCVLVCVDMFTRWVEVVPLPRHDAASVADALVEICSRFGPPRVIRCDNGTEFRNYVVESLFKVFGATVRHGAARHPQSQGCAERFNRTLLTMIRKTVNSGSNWEAELQMLLFFYRTRPHGMLGISPMSAMFGWQPRALIVDSLDDEERHDLADWVVRTHDKAAVIRDYVHEELAKYDTERIQEECPYEVEELVMLRRPNRRQKCLAPFEPGWRIQSIISPTTVVITRGTDQRGKIVNIDLIKRDVDMDIRVPGDDVMDEEAVDEEHQDDRPFAQVVDDIDGNPAVCNAPQYGLRNRATIVRPSRFQ